MRIGQRLQRAEFAAVEREAAAFGRWADTLTPSETRAFGAYAVAGLIAAGHLPPLSTPGDDLRAIAAALPSGPVPATAQNIAAHQELIRLWQTYQQRETVGNG
jgi:hypothetical protein